MLLGTSSLTAANSHCSRSTVVVEILDAGLPAEHLPVLGV